MRGDTGGCGAERGPSGNGRPEPPWFSSAAPARNPGPQWSLLGELLQPRGQTLPRSRTHPPPSQAVSRPDVSGGAPGPWAARGSVKSLSGTGPPYTGGLCSREGVPVCRWSSSRSDRRSTCSHWTAAWAGRSSEGPPPAQERENKQGWCFPCRVQSTAWTCSGDVSFPSGVAVPRLGPRAGWCQVPADQRGKGDRAPESTNRREEIFWPNQRRT